MTKRERVEAVYALQPADRVPFVPAIYEHKGVLIGKSPSEICRSAEWLCAGLRAELEVYDADMLVIGIDVYNVEAEALGCKVVYFAESNDVPGIVEPIVRSPADLARLGVPDPARDGRMPVYLGAARQLYAEMGREVILRGAVTGPYSMAAELIGAEAFVLLTVDDPAFARTTIEFCARVTVEFGKAFLAEGLEADHFRFARHPDAGFAARGAGVAVAGLPRLCAARAEGRRRPLSAPDHRRQHDVDHRRSPRHRGHAVPLRPPGEPRPLVRQGAGGARTPCAPTWDALLVNRGPLEAIRRQALEILRDYHDHPGFLLGCGVVAYDGKREHVHAIRQAIADVASGNVNFARELAD